MDTLAAAACANSNSPNTWQDVAFAALILGFMLLVMLGCMIPTILDWLSHRRYMKMHSRATPEFFDTMGKSFKKGFNSIYPRDKE